MPIQDPERARAYRRKHYHRNAAHYIAKVRARKAAAKRFVASLKEGQSCVRCGYSENTLALDFHHRGKKEVRAANLAATGWSKERILAELEKCVLLCANCHRIVHYG